jgi:hypothetical protein
MRGALALGLLAAVAAGCGERERPPPAPRPDGSAGRDAGAFDAGPPRPRRDAGPPGPTLDGVVDAEWDEATCATSDVATDRPNSTLTRLCALIEDDQLAVAVEATLADGDALVVYVDRALGGGDGVPDLAALSDEDGALDGALSRGLTTPAAFAADFAFGTTVLPRTPVGLDETAGWRALDDPADLTWIAAEEAPLVCSAAACETRLPLSRLGGEPPRTIALFARIVRGDGGLTNQTLPEDDPDAPRIVSELLTLDEGTVPPDGGAPATDGGVPPSDGGAVGVVVDGVVAPGEWAGAAEATSSQPAPSSGPFAGNTLRRLRALRTADRLHVAVEGTLTPGNAYLMYVDRALGGPAGLASPTPLVDLVGGLDRALSKELFTPAEARVDFGWGTLDTGRGATGLDDRMGWRDLGTDPSNFRTIDAAAAPTACSGAGTCETSIALSELGVTAGDTVALFVRLGDADSVNLSNQTLPMDDPAAPSFVTTILEVPPP